VVNRRSPFGAVQARRCAVAGCKIISTFLHFPLVYLSGLVYSLGVPTNKSNTSVEISKAIHKQLKAKAKKEGRLMQRVIEDILTDGLRVRQTEATR
jgi:hypothetical protein